MMNDEYGIRFPAFVFSFIIHHSRIHRSHLLPLAIQILPLANDVQRVAGVFHLIQLSAQEVHGRGDAGSS